MRPPPRRRVRVPGSRHAGRGARQRRPALLLAVAGHGVYGVPRPRVERHVARRFVVVAVQVVPVAKKVE